MMIEVPAAQSNLSALFDPDIPNNPMLFATLLGNTPGRAFVDDPNNPSYCMVRTNEALVFFSQQASQDFFDQGLAHARQFGHVALIWQSSTSTLQIPKADKTIQRLEFSEFSSNNQSLAGMKNGGLPDGFEIRSIDKELLETCEWKEEIESFCGSMENFLSHGFGVCLMRGSEIISESYAPFVGVHNVEIGSVTREAHRGQGYAAITCAHLIQACLERGLQPYWSCDADNLASVNLARKLGFQNGREYEIRMYRGSPK
jgi:RimJ/RimL family protein N-acetyltransferase